MNAKGVSSKAKLEEQPEFICGVIEGFYGRPWTTEQRKDLFRKLKKWGMTSYVYAPKDDYKHRAYWRELYTVEEADHLTSLITAAKQHGIKFYYALSPGLDMTYSIQKEIQTLKRKLDQVSQFGCEAFALLFDDIESELSKADKEVFQTFANAQVSVTNEIYTHLGTSKFLFCPTQYCASRAVPSVHDSEYLNTLGSKLHQDIDILWTGNKVISKIITLESIQEITEVLRRPPVIWDNLHANDYDQKRVFLGPYSGRSPELIPHLRGVMTNPNCEFHGNTIAIHTLAYWSQCRMDAQVGSSLSADIKLETENEEELLVGCCDSKNIYHPRLALKNAIEEWLPEYFIEKEAWGPITKPQPQVQMVMPIIPIIPSINTCMSLTTTTTTTTNTRTVPEVKTTQLQALADVCSTINSSNLTPISNAVMNSLVLPTKVVTNEEIPNPIPSTAASNIELPKKIPISIVAVPIMEAKTVDGVVELLENQNAIFEMSDLNTAEEAHDIESLEEDVLEVENKLLTGNKNVLVKTDNISLDENSLSPLSIGVANEPMECSSSIASQTSPKEESKLTVVADDVVMASVIDLNSMHVEESTASSPIFTAEMLEDSKDPIITTKINTDDLHLLCDLFYLPFEHGSRGLKLLNEFNWLKANANVLLSKCSNSNDVITSNKSMPEVNEWLQRSDEFSDLCMSVNELLAKIARCVNKEICHDLYSYVWDISGALSMLNAYVKWLGLGHFPQNMYSYTQGSYTWFSKGWKEAFMSGDQEPWVFRGGLTADLQRLMPVDSGNDLFVYKLPEQPTAEYYTLRPYNAVTDETEVYNICTRSYLKRQLVDNSETTFELPQKIPEILADFFVGAFVTLNPEFCFVAQDEGSNSIVGYAVAAHDTNIFQRNLDVCWLPEMRDKYPKTLLEDRSINDVLTARHKMNEYLLSLIEKIHSRSRQCPAEVSNAFPATLSAVVLDELQEINIVKRLVTVLMAALRANGCFGVHVCISGKDPEYVNFYSKLGFSEIYRDLLNNDIYFGRRF